MSNSQFVSLTLAIIVTSFYVCLPADAQPLSIGKPNSVVVKIGTRDLSKCNIEVSTPWQEKFEVEVNPPSMEAQFEVTPREPGSFVLNWAGKTKFRGLKSVVACTGSGEVKLIAGYTSETAKPLWDKVFATLSSEQAECVRIGMDSSKLRFSAADPRADVVDPTDLRAKAVFNRCDAFFKLRQSFIDKHNWSETRVIPCTVDGVKTVCEGAYGIPLADGKFMPLSRIDAIRYHHENRPWAPYFREPQSIYDSRIAQAEQVRAEAERQREAKRIAEERAAADRAKQAEEERQREAKRIAEEERQREAKRIAEEKLAADRAKRVEAEKQREEKRIADARAVIEKAENQKSQEKKNFAKDVFSKEKEATASNSKRETAALNRLNDPYWEAVYVDHVRAREDLRKRESHIIVGMDFSLAPSAVGASFSTEWEPGIRRAVVGITHSRDAAGWIVDCKNKRMKFNDADAWQDALPRTKGANVLVHICKLPASYMK